MDKKVTKREIIKDIRELLIKKGFQTFLFNHFEEKRNIFVNGKSICYTTKILSVTRTRIVFETYKNGILYGNFDLPMRSTAVSYGILMNARAIIQENGVNLLQYV